MIDIPNIDYNKKVNLIGTAHFTRRSTNDAYEAVRSLKPEDIALELDWRRYRHLNAACVCCPKSEFCKGLCEFTSAADALGNVDANIWLIDMTEQEIRERIRSRMTPFERPRMGLAVRHPPGENPVRLWEMGYKEKVINNSEKQMEALRRFSPSVWMVLIDERNALMAARLAWIASKRKEGKKPKILAFVGAAHTKGIEDLLRKPCMIAESFKRLNLSFSEPTLIRRVAIQETEAFNSSAA
ncbi:MAG: hypothetical protein V1850_05120 [Candidatus Bathyarchaeota archaeon]